MFLMFVLYVRDPLSGFLYSMRPLSSVRFVGKMLIMSVESLNVLSKMILMGGD